MHECVWTLCCVFLSLFYSLCGLRCSVLHYSFIHYFISRSASQARTYFNSSSRNNRKNYLNSKEFFKLYQRHSKIKREEKTNVVYSIKTKTRFYCGFEGENNCLCGDLTHSFRQQTSRGYSTFSGNFFSPSYMVSLCRFSFHKSVICSIRSEVNWSDEKNKNCLKCALSAWSHGWTIWCVQYLFSIWYSCLPHDLKSCCRNKLTF